MNLLIFLYIPLLWGVLCLLPGKKLRHGISVLASALFLWLAIQLQLSSVPPKPVHISYFSLGKLDFALEFSQDALSRLVLLLLGLFAFLFSLYSIYYYRHRSLSPFYHAFTAWTLLGAAAIVLADNFFVLLLGWEITTLLLFFLISLSHTKAAAMAAGKAFAILGFTDVALILGIVALLVTSGTWNMSHLHIRTDDALSLTIYMLIFVAAIAKAGAMPFHSWIPEAVKEGPLPIAALLPASLDKLLGIYFLARINLDIFTLTPVAYTIMLVVGAITLLFANLMALIQTDLKKFLGFATITQVGYMLIGFGSGTFIGIMAGLFHMVNHALYKTLLFFGVGVVERETGTTEMSRLGGLARRMPFTFWSLTIGCMAASGLPPLNAFVSKWMVYQSTLAANLPIVLIIAMFGSALTLATFLKMWYSLFFGQSGSSISEKPGDGKLIARFTLFIPAFLCLFFGIFPWIPLNHLIIPIIRSTPFPAAGTLTLQSAFYNPLLAAGLLLLGLVLGAMFFLLLRWPQRETTTLFIGGETFRRESHRYSADALYETFTRLNFVGGMLKEGNKGVFDVYNLSSRLGLVVVNGLKSLHDGILSTYLAWCIIGLGIICFILMVV